MRHPRTVSPITECNLASWASLEAGISAPGSKDRSGRS